MRYTDQEDGDSEEFQRTRSYDDHQADLVLDEAHWSLMTADHRPDADSLIRNTQITIMLTSYART